MDHKYDEAVAARIKRGYVYNNNNRMGEGTALCCAAQFMELGVPHGFSTREGGISEPPYASLNLSWSRHGSPEEVEENFRIFAKGAGITYEDMAVVNHEHGNKVLCLDRRHRGRGFYAPPLDFCDGIITNDPYVTLVTSHADCGAYFFYDPVNRAVGLAHAGWKGTLLRIGKELAAAMAHEYGTKAEDIIASTGPCICKKCFEVDAELGKRFADEFKHDGICTAGREGKAYVDLELAAAIQFMDAGIKPENITLMQLCTYEREEFFFSHRRDKGVTGSMAAFIKLP